VAFGVLWRLKLGMFAMIFFPIGITLGFSSREVQTPAIFILRRSQHYQHARSLFWNLLEFSRRVGVA